MARRLLKKDIMGMGGMIPSAVAAAVAMLAVVGCAAPYGLTEAPSDEKGTPAPDRKAGDDEAAKTPAAPAAPSSPSGANNTKVGCDGVTFITSAAANSQEEEWGARWSTDRTRLFVTRKAVEGSGSIFVSHHFGGTATAFAPLLSDNQVEYPALTGSGDSLFVGAQVGSNWQILVAKLDTTTGAFGPAASIGVNITDQDIHPYVVGDALYWAQGPEPARQIHRFDLVTKKQTSKILSLTAKISNPVVTPDELTMYFTLSSDGVDHAPFIHMATRASTNVPFASYQRIDSLPSGSGVTWVSADRCELLFETRDANNRRVVRSAMATPAPPAPPAP